MLVLFLLSLLFASGALERNLLGRGIYVPSHNVLGEMRHIGAQVFKSNKLAGCSVVEKKPVSSQSFTFFKNTKSFYKSVTTSVNLGITLGADFTLGFTLDYLSKRIAGFNRTVAGNSLTIMASSYQTSLHEDCIQGVEFLEPSFLSAFAQLPVHVDRPWLPGSWMRYDTFLRRYGSHMVTSTTYGAIIRQMAFAASEQMYTERDFQIKCCLQLGVKYVDLNICVGIDKQEIKRVSHMTMSDSLLIMGGSAKTRNELIGHRTAELIKKFLEEANTFNSTIEITFTSVWDILQGAYLGTSMNNYLRAINLEYYYRGYRNYGCHFQMSGGQILQMFNRNRFSTPEKPEYECTIAPKGCHSNQDCHYMPVFCACRGYSCVEYKEIMLDTGDLKTVAVAHTEDMVFALKWNGCDWDPKLMGSHCLCRHRSHQRKVVWARYNSEALVKKSGRRMRGWERFPKKVRLGKNVLAPDFNGSAERVFNP